MADPRLAVSITGLHAQFLSAKYDDDTIEYSVTADGGSSQCNLGVTLKADAGVIMLVGDGEFVLGKLEAVESDGICLVQYHGFMTLPAGYGVSAVALGKHIVGDLGPAAAEGYIREVNTGEAAELGVDRGFVWDDSVLAAVELYL